MSIPHGGNTVDFRELSGACPDDVELLRRFYAECYEAAFPDPDERESLANMESYLDLKDRGWYGPNNYHIVIALHGDEIAGASVCDYLAEPNAGVVEYLLVQPGFRASGLGARLLAAIEQLCRTDAAGIAGRQLDWLVAETEDPYRNAPTTGGFDTFARIRVMDRLRFRMLDFDYIQPALSAEQKPADNLLLIARSAGVEADTISVDVVLSILAEYMRWAMRIDDPAGNGEYRRMARSLAWRSSIRLIEFGDYLGWAPEGRLRVVEVTDADDPELGAIVGVYESVYTDPETAWPAEGFRSALAQRDSPATTDFAYHLWGIHSSAAGPCDGMASFVTMPSAGFCGYLAFDHPLRGSGSLRAIIARIEERMVRDNPDARGWYIECKEQINCEIFTKAGFFELDVAYRQPVAPIGWQGEQARRLHLLFKPFGRVYRPPIIARADFLRAVTEIYRVIYGIDAEFDTSFHSLVDSLGTLEAISAVRIGSLVDGIQNMPAQLGYENHSTEDSPNMQSHESIAVVLVDATGVIQYWSNGATALFGHPNSVGRTLDVIVPVEFREQHWTGFNEAMETGVAENSGGRFNIPINCADGHTRSFPGTFSLLCDGHGRATGGIGIWSHRTGNEEPFTPIANPA